MSEEPGPEAVEATPSGFDDTQLQYALNRLKAEQDLARGAGAGVIAALVGAGVWAVVTVATGYQIGWMAVGVGFLVGIAVRHFGKGIDQVFGIVGAVLALIGCLAGNLLAVCGLIAGYESIPFLDVLTGLNLEAVTDLMVASFSPIDLLFYGIAIYEGYKLSFRRLTDQDIEAQLGPGSGLG